MDTKKQIETDARQVMESIRARRAKVKASIYDRRMAIQTDEYTDTWTEDNKPLLEKVGPNGQAIDNIAIKDKV
jgi:hypothetical protein